MTRFEALDPEIRGVLGKKVSELGLRVEGSPVEGYVRQLYKELDRRGFKKFRPVCYLTDEWGCPDQQPVLGIPFYLADQKLQTIEKAADALETDRQIMMYMRHEAGHVFNYAYRLYITPEWRNLFGPFFRSYREEYRPIPFSKHFVRHIEGWYAQKHPDEDFAETFAVWLAPRSPWRRQYKGWPAMRKLRYVDRTAKALADVEPIVKTGEVDITPDDISVTVEQFYEQAAQEQQARIDIALDAHLGQIFLDPPAQGITSCGRYRREAPAGAGRKDHVLDRRPAADRQRVDRFDLRDVHADEAVGRGRGGSPLPRRGHGPRHDPGDELPDARTVRAAMSKLKIVVLYDRVLVDEAEEPPASGEKSPVVRTLDKKEVEEEVAEALGKLGHEPTMHELDGTSEESAGAGASRVRSDLQPVRVVCRRRHGRLQNRQLPRTDSESGTPARAPTA